MFPVSHHIIHVFTRNKALYNVQRVELVVNYTFITQIATLCEVVNAFITTVSPFGGGKKLKIRSVLFCFYFWRNNKVVCR